VLENIGRKNYIEHLGRHVDDARTHRPQNEVKKDSECEAYRERDQRRNRAVWNDAIIDVHREERSGESENVDDEGGNRDVEVICPELLNGSPEPMRRRDVAGRAYAPVCGGGRPDKKHRTEIFQFGRGHPEFDLLACRRIDKG